MARGTFPRLGAGLAFAIAAAGAAGAADGLRYVVLVEGGKRAGYQVVAEGDDGVTRTEFVFKDNGRGPELREEFSLNPDGTFRRYRVIGTSTFGAPVDEAFTLADGVARWTSTSDRGEQRVEAGAQYSPLGGSPAAASVSLAALAARPDGRLPLIPSGVLGARKVAEAQVRKGGDRRSVQLLAITGIGFAPSFAWATDEARPRLFAYIHPGFVQMIEEGWEANADALEEVQKRAESEALVAMHGRLAHRLPGSTLIRNARVFDSEHARLGEASDVRLRDGRIESVVPAGTDADAADHVIDAGGRVLLPGLFDMHAHVSRWSGGLQLAAGVTSVRDMGNDNGTVQQIIAEAAADPGDAADVPAGFLEGESAQSARNGFVVADPRREEGDRLVRRPRLPQLKVYNCPKQILPTPSPTPTPVAGQRPRAGVPARRTRSTPASTSSTTSTRSCSTSWWARHRHPHPGALLPAREAADLTSTRSRCRTSSPAGEKQIVIDPTLATFEFLHQREGQITPIFAGIEDHLPPDAAGAAPRRWTSRRRHGARYASLERMVEFVGRAWRAGVPVVAGTDEVPGFTAPRAGPVRARRPEPGPGAAGGDLERSQVLKRARTLGASTRQGADLVLVDGDPPSTS